MFIVMISTLSSIVPVCHCQVVEFLHRFELNSVIHGPSWSFMMVKDIPKQIRNMIIDSPRGPGATGGSKDLALLFSERVSGTA